MLLLTNGALRLLFIAQALYWSCSLIGITLTSVVGANLAPTSSLATLPLGILMLGNLASVHPLSILMHRHGRRIGLCLGAVCGAIGGMLLAAGIWIESFVLVAIAPFLIGTFQASAMYYRHAALDMVSADRAGRAAALVVGGGVLAAVIAPELALTSQGLFPVPFVGAYICLAGLAGLAAVCVALLPEGQVAERTRPKGSVMRKLLRRADIRGAIAISAFGHGIMILVMTATPLAMKYCGFEVAISANVIRWHLIGMFLPAFLAGPIIDRFGAGRTAILGTVVMVTSVVAALSGGSEAAFLISSLLLGIGWNLMLLAGTALLAKAHAPSERGQAQGLMELANSLTATIASFASGALIAGAGWNLVNIGVVPVLALALFAIWCGRKSAVALPSG
ncbi:MFS transporter [Thalassospira sp. MA62]|nr:MFS transporter [Thalassospira sp. MA62]